MTAHTDSLTRNLLNNIRDTFHLSLMPRKDTKLMPIQAQCQVAALGTTLFKAKLVAERLQCPGDICGVIGTTPAVIDGLRKFFANPAQGDLVLDLRSQQEKFNACIDPEEKTALAIAPYLSSVIPPTKSRPTGGFGY